MPPLHRVFCGSQIPNYFLGRYFLNKPAYQENVLAAHFLQPRRLAGHSHWQNVRHTKEARDKQKSSTAQYYFRAVTNAIKLGQGIRDPKLNSYLSAVLAEAKANSVPFSTLERALKTENTIDPYVIEVQAPGGLFVLVETCAKQVNAERQKLSSILKRYGCTVSPSIGRIAKEFFDHIGYVLVASDASLSDLDAAMNLGIEVGASEVEQIRSGDKVSYQFQCDPHEVDKLRRTLEQDLHLTVTEADNVYVPKCRVQLKSSAYTNLTDMYDKIRDQHEYVDRIFDNALVDETSS